MIKIYYFVKIIIFLFINKYVRKEEEYKEKQNKQEKKLKNLKKQELEIIKNYAKKCGFKECKTWKK